MSWSIVFSDGGRAAIGVPAAVFALAAVGLNVQFGYAGLLNFGHVASLLVGAYGTAIAVDSGMPLPVGFAIGVGAAVVLGLVMGAPTLRLRADYLAIVTISVAEILRILAASRPLEDFTGGSFGITGFADAFNSWNPLPSGERYVLIGDIAFTSRKLWIVLVGWTLVLLASLFVWVLVRSPWGRAVKAIREDEDAARSLGKNAFLYKLQALVTGSVIGAVAGIVLVLDQNKVDANLFQSPVTFFVYTILILGGVARIWAPILGAVIFWFVFGATQSFLGQAIALGWFGSALDKNDSGPIRLGLVGLVLMLLMIFRPQGILGDRAEVMAGGR